ncbi:pyrroline-5-carboxylate reductase [Alteribacillus sp. HJP-4]|uniref:pyrroline-5-carboxylate reductase n=1 Tax=Alteribacillus sp. HJP-4 TaxID=2775394 RepID=UPI0035CCCE41
MLHNQTLAFVGAGSMAESIIGGLLAEQLVPAGNIIVTNKSRQQRLTYLEQRYHVKTTTNKQGALSDASIIILAMKPKHVEESAAAIKEFIHSDHVVISVLAGVSTSYLEQLFSNRPAVIRAMPNTSAKVGASATALSHGYYTSAHQMELAEALFSAVGTVTILKEDKMDAVTGLSGSGPAYLYYFAEAMEMAAKESGLSETEAKELIIQTLAGAARRLKQSEKSTKELYKEVMSPGGTTEAAFSVLKKHHVQKHFKNSIKEAIKRSKELGSITQSSSSK